MAVPVKAMLQQLGGMQQQPQADGAASNADNTLSEASAFEATGSASCFSPLDPTLSASRSTPLTSQLKQFEHPLTHLSEVEQAQFDTVSIPSDSDEEASSFVQTSGETTPSTPVPGVGFGLTDFSSTHRLVAGRESCGRFGLNPAKPFGSSESLPSLYQKEPVVGVPPASHNPVASSSISLTSAGTASFSQDHALFPLQSLLSCTQPLIPGFFLRDASPYDYDRAFHTSNNSSSRSSEDIRPSSFPTSVIPSSVDDHQKSPSRNWSVTPALSAGPPVLVDPTNWFPPTAAIGTKESRSPICHHFAASLYSPTGVSTTTSTPTTSAVCLLRNTDGAGAQTFAPGTSPTHSLALSSSWCSNSSSVPQPFCVPSSNIPRLYRQARRFLCTFFAFVGPGFLVAMAYLDPGNLSGDLGVGSIRSECGDKTKRDSGSASMARADRAYAAVCSDSTTTSSTTSGYQLLWLLLWGHGGGLIFQALAVRLGNVTGSDLATLCRYEYKRPIHLCLWAITELAIIGADVQAVIGSAIALNLLLGLPIWIGILVTLADTFSFLIIQFVGVRKLEALFAGFLAVIAGCFWYNCWTSKPEMAKLLRGLALPSVPVGHVTDAIGLLGCIIMPHNLYLHSALVQSRKIQRHDPKKVRQANTFFTLEAALALLLAFSVNVAVVVSFANPLITPPEAPYEPLSLYTAHMALRKAFGRSSVWIWAIGLLAAGQNATMAGTYAGQFVMQGFLDLTVGAWRRIVVTRLVTILPLTLLTLLEQTSMDTLSSAINVLQAIMLPFAVIPMLKFCSARCCMGEFLLQGWWKVTVWVLAGGLVLVNVLFATVQGFSGHWRVETRGRVIIWKTLFLLCGIGYIGILLYLMKEPITGFYCLYKRAVSMAEIERDSEGFSFGSLCVTPDGSKISRQTTPQCLQQTSQRSQSRDAK